MEAVELPNRLIAFGEEPLGKRVNVYHKIKTLSGIINALDEQERSFILNSSLGGLLDFPNEPAFSSSFGLLLLKEDVTVERVITMLKKRVVTDPEIRLRYACLALVDGFLLPTSHYPKIIKDHAEMAEDLQGFFSYPWGRLSFEMMMTSIKEREVEQLATTCVALLMSYFVVLEAVPAIQEGPQIDEVVLSDSNEEAAADVASRQGVALKLGNAKNVDSKCEAHVEPIIFPTARLNPAEDLTWSDDEDDVMVDNMVKMAKEGKAFSNEMFGDGCIPTNIVVATKKQKSGGKTKVVLRRKAETNARPATGMRRKNRGPIEEEGHSSGEPSSQGDKEATNREHGPHADKEVASGDNGQQADKEFGGAEQNANLVSSLESHNEYDDADFNPSLRRGNPHLCKLILPFHLSRGEDDVGGQSEKNENQQADVEMVDAINATRADQGEDDVGGHPAKNGNQQADVEMVADINAARAEQDLNMPSNLGVGHPGPSTVSPSKSVTTKNTALAPDVVPDPLNSVSALDPLPTVVVVAPPVVAPNPPEESEDFPMFSSQPTITRVIEEIVSAQPTQSSAPPSQSFPSEDFSTLPRPSGGKLLAGKDGGGPDGDVNQGRKSKRPRTLSSNSISIVMQLEIFDIIERKKHFSSKVMDVLIKFRRHLLRTDDIVGEKLRVDVLGSKFVSQLTRLFPKFAKTSPPEDFIFPSALVDLLIGASESDRVCLFAEADCVYMPFNFDKKHWVSLCVDLKAHKITILDSNIQLRRDAVLYAELQPLAAMLPYLFRQNSSSSGNILLQPFLLDRPHGIPQVSSPFDSGVLSVFLIHAHAVGGVKECLEFDVAALDVEVKKLVTTIILWGVAS
ncbi:unnamed protein product [Arabidopsis thaliana]|uniref:(thale cress) hypothetical protein n=1 Tax=Arabidopsis thaliana TaxID=3702 RepID=A0A7G2EU10_ARATH|nr:unnamed protein product [Arabidopsis thaliana]